MNFSCCAYIWINCNRIRKYERISRHARASRASHSPRSNDVLRYDAPRSRHEQVLQGRGHSGHDDSVFSATAPVYDDSSSCDHCCGLLQHSHLLSGRRANGLSLHLPPSKYIFLTLLKYVMNIRNSINQLIQPTTMFSVRGG